MSIRNLIPWRRHEDARRDPFIALRREMDDLFDRFFGNGDVSPWAPVFPTVDVTDTEDEVRISAEIPGMDEKDIDISIRDDVLVIKGEKKQEAEEKDGGRPYFERSSGAFERDIQLPCEVDADKCKAKYARGVLSVTLPKTTKGRSGKKIAISAA
jgi:HSP20 family protein